MQQSEDTTFDKVVYVFPSQSRWHPWEGDVREEWQGGGLCRAALAGARHAQRTHPDVWDQVPSGDWGESQYRSTQASFNQNT